MFLSAFPRQKPVKVWDVCQLRCCPHVDCCLFVLGSTLTVKLFIRLKSWSPVEPLVCLASTCVTCSRCLQQATSRVVLRTCCSISTPPNEARDGPVFPRKQFPNSRQGVCVRDQWHSARLHKQKLMQANESLWQHQYCCRVYRQHWWRLSVSLRNSPQNKHKKSRRSNCSWSRLVKSAGQAPRIL